jgi:allantoinase
MSYDTVIQGNIVLPAIVVRWVLAGAIDAHVHSGSSARHPEGFERLTRAAAVGGVTTVIDMPYDDPHPVTTSERLQAKVEKIQQEATVDVALYGTIAKYGGWAQIVPLARAGVCAFKMSTYETDPERFPAIPAIEVVKAFGELAKTDLVAAFHAENGDIIDALIAEMRPRGEAEPEMHCLSRPPLSETTAVLTLLELARTYPIKLHIVHLTVPFGYDAIAWFRQHGVDATAETCIQYLVLDQSDLTRARGLAKCNPPLRPKEMQEQLWSKLLAGEIDFVTSDHASWPLEVKDRPNIFDNKSGLPGVETLLPLLFDHGVARRGMDIRQLAQLIAAAPARRYGLYPRKGALVVGADADVAILDPARPWTIDASRSQSVAKWSPYDGMRLQGQIVTTLLRGMVVFDGHDVVAPPGTGRFVASGSLT